MNEWELQEVAGLVLLVIEVYVDFILRNLKKKIMQKREANFGLLFRHWHKANIRRMPYHFNFELKQTTKDSISFSDVQEHQIEFLLAGQNGNGLMYKIPDDSRGIKPFDGFFCSNIPGYIIIKFPKYFEIISVSTFVLERDRSKRKSLTSSRAREISVISVPIGKR